VVIAEGDKIGKKRLKKLKANLPEYDVRVCFITQRVVPPS
jgi:hypothetical protein